MVGRLSKGLLVASVLINIVLTVVLLAGGTSLFRGNPAERGAETPIGIRTSVTPQEVALDSAVDADSKEYFDQLSTKTLPSSDKATLLIAHLNRKYEKQLSSSSEYWIERGRAALSIAAAAQARADVLSLVGEGAWTDSAFASLFQPYRREFPTLDPRKQVEVQRVIQSYFQVHEGLEADPSSYREVLDRSFQELRKSIEVTLAPAERVEYAIRISPLADAVRRMRLDLTEQQFRNLVKTIDSSENFSRLVLRLEGQRTSLSLYDPKLTEILGKDKHLAFISRIDPVYGALSSLARSQAVPTEKLQAVYAAFVKQQGNPGVSSEPATQLARSAFGPSGEFIIKQFVHQARS